MPGGDIVEVYSSSGLGYCELVFFVFYSTLWALQLLQIRWIKAARQQLLF